MKKELLTLLIILSSFRSFGQPEANNLNYMGNSLEDIIPTGWTILNAQTGDLNKDGISDLVFVIQDTDLKNIEPNDGLGTDSVDLNPRMLGIYFGTKSGSYQQKLISHDFIPLRDLPTMDEPFEGMKITNKGALEINLKLWYSAGSWSTSQHQYKFRFEDDVFVLIGYASEEAHRGSGETTNYRINFIKRKMKITRGNLSSDNPTSIERRKFKLEKRKTLQSLERPFEWEFEGIYL
ncbi:MAG: hypothetical protein KDC80_02685 [Saprospiraceae bacterium]|nr:hypothetical protein [Saprospiraceae bacterium]